MTESTQANETVLAAKVGPNVSLRAVHTKRIAGELLQPGFEPPLTYSINVQPSYTRVDDHLAYEFSYRVTASGKPGEDADEEPVAELEVTLVLVYQLTSDVELADDELGAFGSVMGTFTAHPYLREAVQSLSVRIGLPPLTLDVVRLPVDGPKTSSEAD